jgi:hypothetical protein
LGCVSLRDCEAAAYNDAGADTARLDDSIEPALSKTCICRCRHLHPMRIASFRSGSASAGLKKQRINKEHSSRFDVNHALSTKSGTISAGDGIMWNSNKYAAMAVVGVGLAVAAATPASAQWLGGGGAYGYSGGCGGYGYAPVYGYAGGCGAYGAYGAAYGAAPAYAGVYSYGWPYGLIGDVGHYGAYGYAGGCGGGYGAYGYAPVYGSAGGCGGYGAYGYAPVYGYAGGCGGYGAYGYAPNYGFAGACRARRHHGYGGYALARVTPRAHAYAAYASRPSVKQTAQVLDR